MNNLFQIQYLSPIFCLVFSKNRNWFLDSERNRGIIDGKKSVNKVFNFFCFDKILNIDY